MTLQLYNTLARKKQDFVPIDAENLRVYVCGPTVYDLPHIGNARPVVVFDVLFRLLRHVYGPDHVTYARNITDVDDKIIKAAQDSGEPIDAITVRTAAAYHADMAALGALEPTIEPRATEHIPQMVALIDRLIARGHAYEAEGHVLFDVPSMPDYGRLSRRNREEQIDGARVEVAPYKKDPADFVLWKPSSDEQPGWESPWGRGRPGWHIECSAMSEAHLGATFDIHGGGQDLIFPHHENELAQSTCATDGGFARYWMHNGYVVVEGEKMSKSLGNFFTVRQLLEEGWPGEAIRLALLSAHYRQPLDITRDKLKESKTQLDRLYGALRKAKANKDVMLLADMIDKEQPPEAIVEALYDDLNTPQALAAIHDLVHTLHRSDNETEQATLMLQLVAGASPLGLLEADPEDWFKGKVTLPAVATGEPEIHKKVIRKTKFGYIDEADIDRLIEARGQARMAKNFAEADRIRDELKAKGIELEDGPQGTTWRREV